MKNEREIVCEARISRVPRLVRILMFVILLTVLTVPAFALDLEQYQSYWTVPVWVCNDEDTIKGYDKAACPIDGMFLSVIVGDKAVYLNGVPSVHGDFTCSVHLEMKSGALVDVVVPVHIKEGIGRPCPIITAQPKAVIVKAGSYAEFYADGYNWDWCAWRFYDTNGEEVIFDVIQKRFPHVTTEGGNSTRFVVRNIPIEMNGWTVCCLFATDKWMYSEKAVITVESASTTTTSTTTTNTTTASSTTETTSNSATAPVPTAAPEPAPASASASQEFVTTSSTDTSTTSVSTVTTNTSNTANAEHVVLAQTTMDAAQQRTTTDVKVEEESETCCFCEFLNIVKDSPILLLILILLIILLILRLLMFRRLTRAARKATVEEVVTGEGSEE